MTVCPRCGTGLLPGASICTACCHHLDDAAAPQPMLLTEVTPPREVDTVISLDADGEARKVTQALTHWPFGGADDETVRTLAQPATEKPEPAVAAATGAPGAEAPRGEETDAAEAERRQRIEAQHAALAAVPNDLRIPNQRSAAFNPLQVTPKPPPNPYLAAERRQQANFRSQV